MKPKDRESTKQSKAEYFAKIDRGRGLLLLKISGFFRIQDVQAFAEVRNAALDRLGLRANEHLTLCDARNGLISSPDVADEFQRLLGDPKYASRKLAYITNAALGRIQAARVLHRTDIAFFTCAHEALSWLFE